MKKIRYVLLLFVALLSTSVTAKEVWPDGTPIPEWFRKHTPTDINKLGKHYRITDYGVVNDSTFVQTEKIQAVIDQAHQAGGGVVIIPQGTFLSGSLFFKPNTHLHLEDGGVLKGSDDISNFAIVMTRMEGQTLKYFAALVNADKVDGFTISGKGTINGNGLRYWKSFWLRREFNPKCTNMDEMRPRLLYVSNCKDVQISGVRLMNSPFWTTHFYKCENVKMLNLYIYAPKAPVKAPSSDAIDIDVCTNFLIKDCYMSVNDDAVVLKGGKGPFADKDENNGANRNIIAEDCTFGFCHSAFTCGSESIHNHNVIIRRCTVDKAQRLFWLKMRPDTPQRYEYMLVEDIKGSANSIVYIKPWTQFFDLKGEKDIRKSYGNNITIRNLKMECNTVFDIVSSEDQYELSDFVFENLDFKASKETEIPQFMKNSTFKNIKINGNKVH